MAKAGITTLSKKTIITDIVTVISQPQPPCIWVLVPRVSVQNNMPRHVQKHKLSTLPFHITKPQNPIISDISKQVPIAYNPPWIANCTLQAREASQTSPSAIWNKTRQRGNTVGTRTFSAAIKTGAEPQSTHSRRRSCRKNMCVGL